MLGEKTSFNTHVCNMWKMQTLENRKQTCFLQVLICHVVSFYIFLFGCCLFFLISLMTDSDLAECRRGGLGHVKYSHSTLTAWC